MALQTYSTFYYGWKITDANRYLDFNDGTNKTATLSIGTYSAIELVNEIKKQMDAVSSLNFTVAFDRVTRKFTIATTVNFILKVTSGVNALISVFPLIGFTGADRTGSTGYVGNLTSGVKYTPQFRLQSYRPTSKNRRAIDGVINKSASGKIEVIKFGDERFMDCEIVFITNIIQEFGSIIRTNDNAVQEYIDFIQWCTDKGTVEFMENEIDVSVFEVLLLESTEQDPDGLDYQLIELYDRDLPEYFRSGNLKFKLIEV